MNWEGLEEIIAASLLDSRKIVDRLDIPSIRRLCERLSEVRKADSTVYVFGNGGSAATASHFVADLLKGTSYPDGKRMKVIALNDNIPTMMAYANDVAYVDIFVEPLKNFLRPGDLVIGISGSGNSENVLRAIAYANSAGGQTFGIVGCGGGKLAELAHESVVVNSNDMLHIEDMHLIVCHIATRVLRIENQKRTFVQSD